MANERLSLKKLKLHQDFSVTLAYQHTETVTVEDDGQEDIKSDLTKKSGRKAHPEFIRSIQKLRIHLAQATEQLGTKKGASTPDINHWLEKEEVISNFQVTGFTIVGTDEAEGIIITGGKRLASGQIFNFNTPLIRLISANEKYSWQAHLVNDVKDIREEAELYFSGKKFDEAGTQMNIFDKEEPGDATVEDFLKHEEQSA